MAAEPLSIVERIKHKLDIVDQIGAVVQLRQSGKAFKGLCPFHGERTPSFYVFPETGTWRCFGCNEGGDLFTFLEKQQGLDFREALAVLAERAGIPLEQGASEGGPSEASIESSIRKRLRALNEAAAIWFHNQLLQASEAQYARSYLASRGVNNESIALWRLGYAPDGDLLARYLQGQGYSVAELVEAGLARAREGDGRAPGSLYDYFRNRLIFPIRDARGATIAFGGRELGGGHPKYLNTPQTVLFDKSATLFGLDLARDAIRRQDRVVIVEGYMDAVVPHQYGSRNVVAVIGSALTEKHVHQIKKLTRRMTLALDPDAAGESATVRGITVAQQAFDRVLIPVPGPAEGSTAGGGRGIQGFKGRKSEPRGMVRFEEQVDAEITVAQLPPGEDPDEFVRRDTAGWQRAIAEAVPLIDFLFEAQTAGLALDTPQGKMEACKRLLPLIAEVRSRTLAGEYVDRLASKLRLDVRELQRDLQLTRNRLDRAARLKDPAKDLRVANPAHAANPSTLSDAGTAQGSSTKGNEGLGLKYPALQQEGATPGYSSTSTEESARTLKVSAGLLVETAQEEYCAGLLLVHPRTWRELRSILEEGDFRGTETRALFAAVATALRSGDDARGTWEEAVAAVVAQLDPLLQEAAERFRARVAASAAADEAEEDSGLGHGLSQGLGTGTGPGLMKRASQAAYRLKRMRLKGEQAELDYLIRDAETAHDTEVLRTLLRRKQQLLVARHTIDEATSLQA